MHEVRRWIQRAGRRVTYQAFNAIGLAMACFVAIAILASIVIGALAVGLFWLCTPRTRAECRAALLRVRPLGRRLPLAYGEGERLGVAGEIRADQPDPEQAA